MSYHTNRLLLVVADLNLQRLRLIRKDDGFMDKLYLDDAEMNCRKIAYLYVIHHESLTPESIAYGKLAVNQFYEYLIDQDYDIIANIPDLSMEEFEIVRSSVKQCQDALNWNPTEQETEPNKFNSYQNGTLVRNRDFEDWKQEMERNLKHAEEARLNRINIAKDTLIAENNWKLRAGYLSTCEHCGKMKLI